MPNDHLTEQFDETVEALSAPDEETRRLAVLALAAYPLETSRAQLFLAMGDKSWRVRKEAVGVFLAAPDASRHADGIFELLRCPDNAGLRNSAAEVLEMLGKSALPLLHDHLVDADDDVRKFAMDIIGVIGDPLSLPFLVKALSDHDPNVRAAAAEGLGKIGDMDAVGPLLDSLAVPDMTLRHTILSALGLLGAPVPLEKVVPFLADNFLKKAVYECLGSAGGADALPVITAGLAEPVKSVREAAVRALVATWNRYRSPEFDAEVTVLLKDLAGKPVVDDLLAIMDAQDEDVQAGLIRILGAIGDERAAAVVLRSCGNERLFPDCLLSLQAMGAVTSGFLESEFANADEGEKTTILRMCGALKSPELALLVQKGMGDPSPQVREAAARAVGKIGLTGLVSDAADLLGDFDQDVRSAALDALALFARTDASEVAQVAASLAVSTDAGKRRDAAYLCGALGDRKRLSLLLKDEDDLVRRTAVRGVATRGGDDAVHLLSLALADEIPEVRLAAVTALGDIGDFDALEPLVLAAGDNDSWVRCAALRSLGKIGGERALETIEQALAGDDALIAIAALEALRRYSTGTSRELVRRAAMGTNGDVVKASVDILAEWDDPWLDEHGQEFLHHPYWDVRYCMVQFLARRRGAAAVSLFERTLESEDDDLVRARIMEFLERFT